MSALEAIAQGAAAHQMFSLGQNVRVSEANCNQIRNANIKDIFGSLNPILKISNNSKFLE